MSRRTNECAVRVTSLSTVKITVQVHVIVNYHSTAATAASTTATIFVTKTN
jgi:hypothetical protein